MGGLYFPLSYISYLTQDSTQIASCKKKKKKKGRSSWCSNTFSLHPFLFAKWTGMLFFVISAQRLRTAVPLVLF